MTEIEKETVIEHFEIELSKYRHNSETLNNKGLRTIYGRKAKMLSLLLHMAKKQRPKKVSVLEMPCETIYSCPNCYKQYIGRENYCSNCGQALDWSDSE